MGAIRLASFTVSRNLESGAGLPALHYRAGSVVSASGERYLSLMQCTSQLKPAPLFAVYAGLKAVLIRHGAALRRVVPPFEGREGWGSRR